MLAAMGRRADAAEIAAIYRDIAAVLVVAPGDGMALREGSMPRLLEHEILLDGVAAARRLAAYLVGLADERGGGQASSRA
jgi:hypothetical protein